MAVRVLICGPANRARALMSELVQTAEHFSLVGTADDAAAAVQECRRLLPDMMIIDEAITGQDATELATNLALQRPLPTLLLTHSERPPGGRDAQLAQRLRIYRLAKARIAADDSLARALARTKLYLVGSRISEARATLPVEDLASVVYELREEEESAFEGVVSASLGQIPLDLVLIVSAQNGADMAVEIVRQVEAVRVPTVLAMSQPRAKFEQLQQLAPTRLTRAEAEGAIQIRRIHGIHVVLGHVGAAVDGEALFIRPTDTLDLCHLVSTVSTLGTAWLIVVVGWPDAPLVTALDTAAEAGGHVLSVGAALDSHPQLSVAGAAAVVANALPRRI